MLVFMYFPSKPWKQEKKMALCSFLETDHRITESLSLENTSKIIQTNCPSTTNISHWVMSLSKTSKHFFNTSKDGDSTTSQGSPFQSLTRNTDILALWQNHSEQKHKYCLLQSLSVIYYSKAWTLGTTLGKT